MIPFRNDHVGSFLRPADLSQAREQYKSGNITYEELRAVEDKEIIRIIDKQKKMAYWQLRMVNSAEAGGILIFWAAWMA